MAYKVNINVGKSRAGSIPLPNKVRVSNYISRHPFGNSRTQVTVTNLKTKKVTSGSKLHFSNPERW